MTTLSALAGELQAIQAQQEKARAEILGKITNLETALANTELPADAVAALEALKASTQTIDDIVPDAVPPTV